MLSFPSKTPSVLVMDDRRKPIKTYVLPNGNTLVWIGENNAKTGASVGENILLRFG